MSCKVLAVLFSLSVAAANAGLIAAPSVQVLQGPGSRTTLIGPDGSALKSAAPGGTLVTGGDASLVPVGPAALAASPDIWVRGPAGALVTSYTAAGPAVVPAVAAPVALAAPGALGALVGVDGDDHAGDYVPDNTELLYDDGSYRGEH